MEISQIVSDAIKKEITNSFQLEMKRRKINPTALVKKFFDSKDFKCLFDKEIKRQAKLWFDDNDFFEDLPDEIYKRINKNAYNAIFK